jgi:serine/threonine protein phosphatase PrpC
VLTDQEVVDFINKDPTDAQKMSEKLLYYALERGTRDNVTVMVVSL